jgi:hypothetical protein
MANIPETASNVNAAMRALADNHVLPVVNAGAPTNGTTGNGFCGKGTLLIDVTNGILYINTGTKSATVWTKVGTQT